jgi:hypothetical protein
VDLRYTASAPSDNVNLLRQNFRLEQISSVTITSILDFGKSRLHFLVLSIGNSKTSANATPSAFKRSTHPNRYVPRFIRLHYSVSKRDGVLYPLNKSALLIERNYTICADI